MTRWMEIAWENLGVSEVAGSQANPRIVEYFRGAGRPDITSDEIAWCAAFNGYCLHNAGIPLNLPPGEELLASSYLNFGTAIDKNRPRVGAIAVVHRKGGSGYHVAFVSAWTDTHLKLLGGNQRDSVCEAWFPRSSVAALRWPEVVTPKEVVEKGSRIATGANEVKKDAGKGAGTFGLEWLLPSPDQVGIDVLATKAASFKGSYETLQAFGVFAWQHKGAVLSAILIYLLTRMAWRGGWIKQWRAEDASTGKTT